MRTLILLTILSATACAGLLSWSPTVSVQVTTPQRYSLSLGISGVDWGSAFGSESGFLIRVEPGVSGGKLHAGTRNAFSLALIPILSVDVTGALMYTWNDPWNGLQDDQTYAGMELRFGALPVVVSAGYYKHIAGSDTEHNWIGYLGAGIGF
ncbi:MAG: hypothetical protein K8S62_05215 [Candidatus Sabulitectum sp.]|nr:hypothetical protein [Candidatus Sabulitectum sp.]